MAYRSAGPLLVRLSGATGGEVDTTTLLEAAARGDQAAWDALVDRYASLLDLPDSPAAASYVCYGAG